MSSAGNIICENCGGKQVSIEKHELEFPYGAGLEAVTLRVLAPVYVCGTCDFMFTDEITEKLKHDAICEHIKLLTSDEIVSIRKKYGFNRSYFAALTKIGAATLHSWETGARLQNPAMDIYLRLLDDPKIMQVVEEWHSNNQSEETYENKFKHIRVDDDLKKRSAEFSLRVFH